MKEGSGYYIYEAMDFHSPSETRGQNENGNANNHVKRRLKISKSAEYPSYCLQCSQITCGCHFVA